MKVLLIDGPKAGVVYEVQDGSRQLVSAVLNRPGGIAHFLPASPSEALNFETVVYTFHRCLVFGHHMTLGSVNPGGPRDCDLFRLLTSDLAKAAVNV